jgi:hypothetical protein
MKSMTTKAALVFCAALLPFPSRNQTTAGDSVFYHWEMINAQGTLPVPRAWQSAVIEPVNGRMLVFGGFCQPPYLTLNDLWSFTMTSDQWQKLIPSGSPPPARAGHCAVYVPYIPVPSIPNRMVIFGGRDYWGSLYNDTWAYDVAGNSWSQIITSGTPPSARYAAASVYSPISNSLIIFGGCTGAGYSNETWTLDLNSKHWSLLTTLSPPSPRERCTAIYDGVNYRIILFGGDNGITGLKDNYVLTLSTLVWTRLPDYSFPVTGQTSVFDPGSGLMISAGGTLSDSGTVATLSTGTGNWLNSSAGGNPPGSRYNSASVWDTVSKRVILTGGQSAYTGYSNETYQLTCSVVPQNCQVSLDTIRPDETFCNNAWNTLTTGGNSHSFYVFPGGSVDLISGKKISMQINSRVNSGAYIHAFITSNGQYCDSFLQPSMALSDRSITPENPQITTYHITGLTGRESNFRIYPNPTGDKFFIYSQPPGEKPSFVRIVNFLGSVVFSEESRKDEISPVQVSFLPDGLYFVTIGSGSSTSTLKLIKSERQPVQAHPFE